MLGASENERLTVMNAVGLMVTTLTGKIVGEAGCAAIHMNQ